LNLIEIIIFQRRLYGLEKVHKPNQLLSDFSHTTIALFPDHIIRMEVLHRIDAKAHNGKGCAWIYLGSSRPGL
jgi:hypothetical protein